MDSLSNILTGYRMKRFDNGEPTLHLERRIRVIFNSAFYLLSGLVRMPKYPTIVNQR